MNLIGEHVDYAGGLVLPCAIDRFVLVEGAPGDDWEAVSPEADGTRYVRAIGTRLGTPPQRCRVSGDLPVAAGLSSSAALLMATARGLAPGLGGREAAILGRDAEEAATGVRVGLMDQLACALGRRDHALLIDCRTLETELVPMPPDLVIAVLDSQVSRELAATPYNQRRAELEAGMERRVRHVRTEIERVREFVAALRAGDHARLGSLLDASHASLRDDYEVSIPALDELCDAARALPGCLGARLMGAGFGGSVLALVEADRAAAFAANIRAPVLLLKTADGAFA